MMKIISTYIANHPKVAVELGRIMRFGVTGVICSCVHYGVYCAILLMANANVAYTLGYGAGLILNYFMTTYFTFQKHPSKRNLSGFIGSHAINYLLEIGLLNLFLWLGLSKWLAPIAVMVIVVPINFMLLQLVYTFKRKKKNDASES